MSQINEIVIDGVVYVPKENIKAIKHIPIFLREELCFEVNRKDEPEKMTWNEAMDKFKNNKDGWRLPTIIELGLMYKYKSEIPNLKDDWYWSSTPSNVYYAYSQYFSNGGQYWDCKDIHYRVRCVRSIIL